MIAEEDYSKDTLQCSTTGTRGDSRLMLAFIGRTWTPGPTSVGL